MRAVLLLSLIACTSSEPSSSPEPRADFGVWDGRELPDSLQLVTDEYGIERVRRREPMGPQDWPEGWECFDAEQGKDTLPSPGKVCR